MKVRRWQFGALGALAGAALLGVAAVGYPSAAADAGMLAVPVGAKAAGTLKAFDARATEAGCQVRGAGKAAGNVEVAYEAGSRTLTYTITLRRGQPNTDYLLDVSECAPGGERLARGDGGHTHTDAQGNADLTGSWVVQAQNAKWVKASLVPYCGPDGQPPVIPCGDTGFATDALLPPGR